MAAEAIIANWSVTRILANPLHSDKMHTDNLSVCRWIKGDIKCEWSLLLAGICMVGFGIWENIYLICLFAFLFFAMLPFANNCLDYPVAALENDAQVEKYVVLQTGSYPAVLPDGGITNLTAEMGDHLVFPVSYTTGAPPAGDGEIALSSLYAEELGLSVGDTLRLLMDGNVAGMDQPAVGEVWRGGEQKQREETVGKWLVEMGWQIHQRAQASKTHERTHLL